MSIFKRNREHDEILPLDLRQTPQEHVIHRIVASIDSLGFDKDKFMLIGSAGLAAYDIDLGIGRPGDVDLLVQPSALLAIEATQDKTTPGGVEVTVKDTLMRRQDILSAHTTDPNLPVDLISGLKLEKVLSSKKPSDAIKRVDERFTAHLEQSSNEIPGTEGIRVAKLSLIKRYVSAEAQFDSKYKRDLAAILAFERHIRSRS